MKISKKKIIVLIILAAIVLFAVALIKRKKHKLANAPKYGMRPVSVRVITAELNNFATKIDYLSVVEPLQITNISARLTTNVDKVKCDEGSVVKEGDVLVVLDSREIESDIASVQADIAKAHSELAANEATVTSLNNSVAYWVREAERDKILAGKGSIPGAQSDATIEKASDFEGKLDSAKHTSKAVQHLISSLESKKSQLKTRLSYCTILSPYDGLVTQRLVDPGNLALPGKNLLVVEDRSQMKLAFDIPQQDLSKVHKGISVRFSAGDKTYETKLSHLYPSLNRARMLRAEVFLTDDQKKGLISGQYLTSSILLNEINDAVTIPASCLIEDAEHFSYVFIVKNGMLTQKKVSVLASTEDQVAVAGIEPDNQVVTNTFLGWTILSNGKKVEVLK